MKHHAKIAAFAAILSLAGTAQAQSPDEHAGHQPPPSKMAHRDIDPVKIQQHLKAKQEHQLMMHDLSNKILSETDPQKQQALKDQQLEMMKKHHQHMMNMHGQHPAE